MRKEERERKEAEALSREEINEIGEYHTKATVLNVLVYKNDEGDKKTQHMGPWFFRP